MKPTKFIRSSLAALTLGLTALGSQAAITAAASVTGPISASNFNATVVPTMDFINNNAKLYVVVIHHNTVYVHSGSGGFVVYHGGELPYFRTITSASESFVFSGWDLSGLPGAQIFLGYGNGMDDMLANNRYIMVYGVPSHPVSPPAPQPPNPGVDAIQAYSGIYRCYNEYYRQATVSVQINPNQAIVDTTNLYDIPIRTMSVPYDGLNNSGDRVYKNNIFPLKMVMLDVAPGKAFPISIGYVSSYYSTPRIWVCQRESN